MLPTTLHSPTPLPDRQATQALAASTRVRQAATANTTSTTAASATASPLAAAISASMTSSPPSTTRTADVPSGPVKGEDQHAELAIDIAAAYQGSERSFSLDMPTLTAQGEMTYTRKTLHVKIPKGIAEGQQIRLAGQGLAGYNGGANGDLYLKIRFHARPDLYVKNRKDVYQTISVMPWQAVLGGKITVATASGRLQVTLPANSHNGKTIRLKGQGIPAKEAGDLYLVIHIAVPEANSEADRALWQQLADHYAQSAH